MESMIAVLIGVGLAASCGFRVFVPMLVASVAARTGYLEIAQGFGWLSTDAALIALSIATLMEIAAYYVPWFDNLLDTVASPSAVIAGIVLFAACVTDVSPFLRWTLAAIAGGGSAAVVQGGSVASRLAATTTTGGFANAGFSTVETASGFFFSILSIVVPVAAIVFLLMAIVSMYFAGRAVMRRVLGRFRTVPKDL